MMFKVLDESGEVRVIIDHISEFNVTPELKSCGIAVHGYTTEGEHFAFVFPTEKLDCSIVPVYKAL